MYKWVIEDVIEKMSLDFAQQGFDESVLHEIQQSWEQKLVSQRILSSSSSDKTVPPHPLNNDDPRMALMGFPSNLNSGVNSRAHSVNDLAAYYQMNQTDGSQESLQEIMKNKEIELRVNESDLRSLTKFSKKVVLNKNRISQLDGAEDDEDDEDDLDDDEEENIGSDLDEVESDGEVEAEHIILCQYEKVLL